MDAMHNLEMRRKLQRAASRMRAAADRHRGRPTKTQVVICGFPRSGTSLLYNMMATCLRSFHHDDFEHTCLEYVYEWRNTLSKRPLDIFRIQKWVRKNKLAKRLLVIVLIRDPRDIVTSRHPRVPDDYFIGWEHCYRVDGPSGPEPVHPGIEAIASEIAVVESLAGVDLVRVRYEDLVSDPDDVQSRLAERTGLTFEGRFADFHSADRLAYKYENDTAALDPELVREDRPIDASRAGKWRAREHWKRIRDEFGQHSGLLELVRSYGYEDDDSWFRTIASDTD
jgi:hypothetical protein